MFDIDLGQLADMPNQTLAEMIKQACAENPDELSGKQLDDEVLALKKTLMADKVAPTPKRPEERAREAHRSI